MFTSRENREKNINSKIESAIKESNDLIKEFVEEKITENKLTTSLTEIINKLFANSKNNDERNIIFKKLSLRFHPDKNADSSKSGLNRDFYNKFTAIINNERDESLKSLYQKFNEFKEKLLKDQDYINKLIPTYAVPIIILSIETVLFNLAIYICMSIPIVLLKTLYKLNYFILNNLSSNIFKEVIIDYFYSVNLLNDYNWLKSIDTNFSNDYPTFDSYKQTISKNCPTFDSYQEFIKQKYNEENVSDFNKESYMDPVNMIKLYFIYLYKALYKNDANQSLAKRIALLPVYTAMFFVLVATELFRLAISVSHVALFLAWLVTVLATVLPLTAPILIFKKLFGKEEREPDNGIYYSASQFKESPTYPAPNT